MDRYSIQFMGRAVRDLDEIYAYIAGTLQVSETALKLVDEIEAAILSLEQMPSRLPLRRVGVYARKGYRQLFIKNYTVVFRVDENKKQVLIVTVRYSKSSF